MTDRLPDEVAEALRAMRKHRDPRLDTYLAWMRRQNWSGAQIAEPLGLTRQAVNMRVARYMAAHDQRLPMSPPSGLPRVPYLKHRPRVSAVQTYSLPVTEAASLIGLWMLSSRVRNLTPEDHPNRKASALFDERVANLVREGYSLSQIAHDISVEERLLRLRLARHGLTMAYVREVPDSAA